MTLFMRRSGTCGSEPARSCISGWSMPGTGWKARPDVWPRQGSTSRTFGVASECGISRGRDPDLALAFIKAYAAAAGRAP